MVTAHLLALLLVAAPDPETALGPGFADVAFAGDVAIIASGDGTVRSLHGSALDIAFTTGKKMVGVAVSNDMRRVAVVGAGVVARSDDGGHIFRVEPLPDNKLAYAVAFVADALLVFDRDGRGYRTNRTGRFEAMSLPLSARWWTASFDGPTGWVVGEGGALIGTRDGGDSWFKATSPDPAPQGVLTVGGAVYVAGQRGVWKSSNGGDSFKSVLTLPGENSDCIRMARSGSRIAVACTPLGHTLYKSDDGERFDAIAAPDAANMLGVAVSSRGDIVAVGSYELVLQSQGRAGTLLYHSAETRKWQQVLRALAAEKVGKQRGMPGKGEKPRAPSPEARVVLGSLEFEGGQPAAQVEVRLESTRDEQTAKTDAFGRFRFIATGADTARISASAKGYAPAVQDIFVRPLDATVVTLVFRKAAPLGGQLRPAMAATVRLFPAPPPDADRVRYPERAQPLAQTRSDAQGRFSFEAVPPGAYLVQVLAEGFAPYSAVAEAPSRELTFTLVKGARLTGRFIDSKGPLGGSSVRLIPSAETKDTARAVDVNADGEFELSGLSDGRYALEATSRERKICVRRELEVTHGAPVDIVLRLGRGRNISGQVIDQQGAPVPGARVMGTTASDPLCGARVADADERGEFILEDVADSQYSVSAVILGATIRSGRAFAETDAAPGERITVKVTR